MKAFNGDRGVLLNTTDLAFFDFLLSACNGFPSACLLLATACYTARGSATTPLRRPQEEEHTISMGRVVYFLIATLLLVSRTEAAVFDGLLTCHRICPAVLRPVCGSDGRTYDNSCQLQEARCSDPSLEEVHPGPCPGAEALLL
ncbi:SPARC-related modular calcium-binding protein 2 [Penaeus vannamei]|uniref:SPARC-related modular calcium-binding protein 2 n=1 Tax=Penaeus vannamei TaxID=6689 RepID=A0A3R7NRW6_PENVA|nr:SPARC-related modular calcium-binding protein 2 [Penaeus vannamei]